MRPSAGRKLRLAKAKKQGGVEKMAPSLVTSEDHQTRKTRRVQLEMPPRSMDRLIRLKEKTEAISYAEVIKNAIRLYEAMLVESEAGREFLIKDQNGNISPYRVFLETWQL